MAFLAEPEFTAAQQTCLRAIEHNGRLRLENENLEDQLRDLRNRAVLCPVNIIDPENATTNARLFVPPSDIAGLFSYDDQARNIAHWSDPSECHVVRLGTTTGLYDLGWFSDTVDDYGDRFDYELHMAQALEEWLNYIKTSPLHLQQRFDASRHRIGANLVVLM